MTGKRTRPPESVRGVMKQRAEALHGRLVSEGWELLNFASLARVMFTFGQTPDAHPTGSMKQYRPTGTNHGHTEAPQTRLYAPAWMCSVAQAVQWGTQGQGGSVGEPVDKDLRGALRFVNTLIEHGGPVVLDAVVSVWRMEVSSKSGNVGSAVWAWMKAQGYKP